MSKYYNRSPFIGGHYGLGNIVLCTVRGPKHNALATGHMGRGHYGWLLSLDKRASFGISTWKQMLIQIKESKPISGHFQSV